MRRREPAGPPNPKLSWPKPLSRGDSRISMGSSEGDAVSEVQKGTFFLKGAGVSALGRSRRVLTANDSVLPWGWKESTCDPMD